MRRTILIVLAVAGALAATGWTARGAVPEPASASASASATARDGQLLALDPLIDWGGLVVFVGLDLG